MHHFQLSAMYTCRTLHNLGKPLLEASIRFDADKFTRHYSVYMRLAPGVRAVHIATAGEVAMPYWIDPVRGDLKRFFDACTNLKAIQLELPNWDEEETETRFASGGARFLPKEVHFLSLQFDGCDVKGWALAPLVDEGTKLVVNMLELRPLHFCNMEGHQEEGLFQSTESYIQADDYRVVPCFSDLEIPDPIDDGDLSYS